MGAWDMQERGIAILEELGHSRVVRRTRRQNLAALAAWVLLACGGGKPEVAAEGPPTPPATASSAGPRADCPESPVHLSSSPGVQPRHTTLQFWLERAELKRDNQPALLTKEEIDALNQQAAGIEGAWRDLLAPALGDSEAVRVQLLERVQWMRGQVDAGKYVEAGEGDFERAEQRVEGAIEVDELRVVVEESSLRCMPLDQALYKPPVDEDLDRNNCASLHAGEWVRVLRRWEQGEEAWDYVHAGHSVGWLKAPALTPSIERDLAAELLEGPQWVVVRDGAETRAGRTYRLGTRLPLTAEGELLVPTSDGFVTDHFPEGSSAARGDQPLTRELVWGAALSELDAPYGWGGRGGERDCSRLVRDVFLPAGIQLGRHSAVQARLGSEVIDVSMLDEATKRARIEAAARDGLVLLYMPGHIMIYLGRDGEHQYAVSSISEYLTPCEGGEDTVNRIDRVAVTTLELGRDTKKRAFIERISALVVFGPEPSGD